MSAKTSITWTDHTFNMIWGCTKVSPGCDHCYAEAWAKRCGQNVWGQTDRRTFGVKHWAEPLAWNERAIEDLRPHLVFGSSMGDVFENHPTVNQERAKLWSLIRRTPNLIWQLLTKRPENIAKTLPDDWGAGYPNVWLGVSAESEKYAAERIAWLRATKTVLRFLSYEPALGMLRGHHFDYMDWVIYGGESGEHFRPHDVCWARLAHDCCRGRGIPFFYKQSPGRRSGHDPYLDGRLIQEFPAQADRPEEKPG